MSRMFEHGASLVMAACCAVILGSCGGGVSGVPAPDPAAGTPLTITPSTAELLVSVPTTFTITGGAGGYTAFSSNSGVLPITTNVTGSTFTVTANSVNADTAVDITVRDAANASATAKVTVKFTGIALAISPSSAILFPDLPATFTITGGRSGYTAFSNNSAVLPVAATVVGSTFSVVPNAVIADTEVEITVRDATSASVTAKATVKPSALLNQITFTPFGPTGTGCGANTVCSGGDAQIVVKAVQNGVILRNRQIRFNVFQGGFQLVTPVSGALVNSLLADTDEQGNAVARITANVGAITQVATIQTTDVASGLARRYNFTIVQQTSGVGILSTLPSGAITITGSKGAPGADGSCPAGATVDYYIYGGSPPYVIASPLTGVATVSPSGVGTSGGRFTATVTGCGKVAFIVTDASGRTIETSTLEAAQGAKGDAAPTASLTVTPSGLLLGCGQSAGVSLTGSGSYTASTVLRNIDPSLFSLTPGAGTIPGTITFTRSNSGTVKGTVSLSGTQIDVNIVSGSIIKEFTVFLTGGSSTVSGTHTCP